MLINHNYVGFTKLSCITSEIGICLSKCFCRIQIEFVRSLPFFFFFNNYYIRWTSASVSKQGLFLSCSYRLLLQEQEPWETTTPHKCYTYLLTSDIIQNIEESTLFENLNTCLAVVLKIVVGNF